MSNNFKNEYWTVTAGDLSSKRYRIEAPEYSNTPTNDVYKIVVDQSVKYQDWIGVGAAITDASAKLIWNQTANQRHDLLEELFSPEKGNFSVIRIPIGACDFSSQNYYSYDDLPFGRNDHDLKYFSIGEGKPGTSNATKDLKYIIPVLQEILMINPAVKIIASPWSGPAWIKNSGQLTMGGHLRFGEFTGNGFADKDRFESVYANYFIKYLRHSNLCVNYSK